MKNILLPLALLLTLSVAGCKDKAAEVQADEEKVHLVEVQDDVRYKLYETSNMWNFIKLDTRTGRMWLVQFSVDDDNRFVYDLNSTSLVRAADKVNGRFELYPTDNFYNFILLDRISGKTWQVQWSFEPDKVFVIPIE